MSGGTPNGGSTPNGDPALNPIDSLDGDAVAAPPRANGELVFTAPWQSRLFATTMRLWEQGVVDWEIFRQGLIVQIALHEADLPPVGPDDTGPGDAYDYWGCWQRALEKLLADLGVVSADELAVMGRTVAARPPDH